MEKRLWWCVRALAAGRKSQTTIRQLMELSLQTEHTGVANAAKRLLRRHFSCEVQQAH